MNDLVSHLTSKSNTTKSNNVRVMLGCGAVALPSALAWSMSLRRRRDSLVARLKLLQDREFDARHELHHAATVALEIAWAARGPGAGRKLALMLAYLRTSNARRLATCTALFSPGSVNAPSSNDGNATD